MFVGQLHQGGVEDGDVVSGGVTARVSPSRRGGEELAGVVGGTPASDGTRNVFLNVGAASSFSL
jgi:hypothetical protein